MYVDLFLLYLLYKFTKPMSRLDDGRTTASAVLFAHDHATAGKTILKSLEQREEERKGRANKSQTENFINYVIAEWTKEMSQEVAISYELLDQSDSKSSVSYMDDDSNSQTISTHEGRSEANNPSHLQGESYELMSHSGYTTNVAESGHDPLLLST